MKQTAAPETDSLEALVSEVTDDFLKRLDGGEQPSVEEFARCHPEIAAVLRQVLPALIALRLPSVETSPLREPLPDEAEKLGRLGDFRLIREIGRGGMGIVYEAFQTSLGRCVALKVLPFAAALDSRQLARFKNEAHAAAQLHHTNIVPVFAVGCERGVHYYAMQLIHGKTLAAMIEELRGQEPKARSARTGAGVQDSAHTTDGRVALGPKLKQDLPSTTDGVAGSSGNGKLSSAAAATVKVALSTQHTTREPAWYHRAAKLGMQAAEALAHAHGQGVVHRDIKPANLLIDAKGTLWIADFGLAQLQSDAGLTMTGDLVGTLRYMSPEQALASRTLVDHRTDIYSLGATLYELLSLTPAFDGRDRHEVLRQIATNEPRPPRRLNSAIPVELENIVLKAMEKNPADRYQTAQELADDLQRFLNDEPIWARRPSLVQRARKWARRHKPAVASVGISVPIVLCLAVAALGVSNVRIKQEHARTLNALTGERRAKAELEQASYVQRIALAGRELAAGNVGRAEELLNDCPEHLRGWEWAFLKRQRYDGEPTPLKHSATATRVAFSPDGERIASACYDGTFQIWDSHTLQKLYSLEQQMADGRPVVVRGLAYSPDGRYLALARHDGLVRVWDAIRGQHLYTLAGHQGPAWQVEFSPDSRTLASAGADKSVRLWDMGNGELIQAFVDHPAAVRGVAFRPDDRSVVAACEDGTVKVWDRHTGSATFIFRGQLHYPFSAWFSRDARRLAWSCMDGSFSIWDTLTGELQVTKQTNSWQLRSVSFHPDGKLMALACFDGTVRLLEADKGTELFTIYAHPVTVAHAVFSPDGSKIASGSYDHTVRVWDATPLEGDPLAGSCVTLTGHQAMVCSVAFSPDNRWLASASRDGTAKVWEARSRQGKDIGYVLRYTLRGHTGHVRSVAFSTDNRTLASGGWDRTVKLWDLQSPVGESLAELKTITCSEPVIAVEFSPDAELLAIGQFYGIRIYDPVADKDVAPFKRTPSAVPGLAFTPNGRYLASASASDPTLKFWSVAGEKTNFEIPHFSNACVAVSPDGRLVAAPSRLEAAGASALKVWEVLDWDATSGQHPYVERHTLIGHAGRVFKAAFSPDSRYIASGSWDSTIKVWDLKRLENDPRAEPVTLRGHAGFIYGLAFSPDGRRLASASGHADEGEIKIWDASLWDGAASEGR